ncbi:MAG: hypothetical protein V4671_23110, partial [Armatimonadota bacterium]
MRQTAILTTLITAAAACTVSAQTTIQIPRIVNQRQPSTAAKPSANLGNAAFSYVGTPSLRRQALESYLARIARKSPSRAKMLSADFARNDADKLYQSLIANTGLQNYDVADALTAYNLTGWIIANGVKTVPPRSQIVAARRQTAIILAKNPTMANAGTRGRAGEEFKLMTVTLHFGLLSARRSGDSKAYA